MQLIVDIQNMLDEPAIPDESSMHAWILQALQIADLEQSSFEITVRIVDEKESQQLNGEYRGKDKPTNVLSFPFEVPEVLHDEIPCHLLGDLVVCHAVVVKEAAEQGKTLVDHWAHMLVHGTLHLLGYDHIETDDAEQMEALEVQVLDHFKIKNPY